MAAKKATSLAELVREHEGEIETAWLGLLRTKGGLQTGRIKEAELQTQCRNFLGLLTAALAKAGPDVSNAAYAPVRDLLGDVSRSRALQGFSPSETATFVFSLKQALFEALNRTKGIEAAELAEITWNITLLLDELGLYTMEVFQKSREEVIVRQQREIAELSTPVIKLWQGVLAV